MSDKEIKPSMYQQAVLDCVANENCNILVNAKAGSGKTSILLMLAKYCIENKKRSLFLAYNKSIAEELRERIPKEGNTYTELTSNGKEITKQYSQVVTTYSAGNAFLKGFFYNKYKSNDKYHLNVLNGENGISRLGPIIEKLMEDWCAEDINYLVEDMDKDRADAFKVEILEEFSSGFDFCRLYCINFDNDYEIDEIVEQFCPNIYTYKKDLHYYRLVFREIKKEVDRTILDWQHPSRFTKEGKAEYDIDFTDMVYFPVEFNMYAPIFYQDLDFILVDEAQDTSILQQRFLQRLRDTANKKGTAKPRMIFVGDNRQAIYGFSGADVNSIDNLRTNFQLKELPLSICYRCPKNVVELAQEIVPDLEYNKVREDEGTVECIERDKMFNLIQPDNLVLSRLCTDLITIYKQCERRGIPVKFKDKKLVQEISKLTQRAIGVYIDRFNRGRNIDKRFDEEWDKREKKIQDMDDITGEEHNTLLLKEREKLIKELIEENLAEKQENNISIQRSNYTIDYLEICMQEFLEKGHYDPYATSDTLSGFYSIIVDYIEEFKKNGNGSIWVRSLIDYIKKTLLEMKVESGYGATLSTVHMMKGGEADTVFIYDYDRFPYDFSHMSTTQHQQEENLQYVAITRAKQTLYLVESEDDDYYNKEIKGGLVIEC